jgi:hypothetical protein
MEKRLIEGAEGFIEKSMLKGIHQEGIYHKQDEFIQLFYFHLRSEEGVW